MTIGFDWWRYDGELPCSFSSVCRQPAVGNEMMHLCQCSTALNGLLFFGLTVRQDRALMTKPEMRYYSRNCMAWVSTL
jgi:hypothetical protein